MDIWKIQEAFGSLEIDNKIPSTTWAEIAEVNRQVILRHTPKMECAEVIDKGQRGGQGERKPKIFKRKFKPGENCTMLKCHFAKKGSTGCIIKAMSSSL